MATRTVTNDPITKRRVQYHDDQDGYVIETKQDVQFIVDKNQQRRALTDERARWNEMAHVAEIPIVVWADLWRKGIAQDEKALRKWIDDPVNFAFKSRYGSLSK